MKWLQKVFLAGVLALLPFIVSYYIVRFLFDKVSGVISPYLRTLLGTFGISLNETILSVVSLMLIFLFIVMAGILTRMYLGKKLLVLVDHLASNIPIVRGIYKGTKQIVDAFQSSDGTSNFKKVVMIEYPRKGIFSMGFVTKDTSQFFNCMLKEKCYNIFLPTTPNPTSGFILIVPQKDCIELDISIEEGIKFVISAGLVTPSAAQCLEKDDEATLP